MSVTETGRRAHGVNVISRRAILDAGMRHPDAESALTAWYKAARQARWESLHEVHAALPFTDQVECCLVFNVCGNKYRLICRMSYANPWTNGTLWVKHFLTHAEYDKQKWKKDCLKGRAQP